MRVATARARTVSTRVIDTTLGAQSARQRRMPVSPEITISLAAAAAGGAGRGSGAEGGHGCY